MKYWKIVKNFIHAKNHHLYFLALLWISIFCGKYNFFPDVSFVFVLVFFGLEMYNIYYNWKKI